jgi:hypothetical protein
MYLEMQIETELHRRQGKATTNFAERLPAVRSDLAQQLLKDPYLFGFLGLEPAEDRGPVSPGPAGRAAHVDSGRTREGRLSHRLGGRGHDEPHHQ